MALTGYRNSILSPYNPPSIKSYPQEFFSGVDVSVFFTDVNGNEQYIDEIRDIEFTLEERVIPVYGYASYTAQKMVHGVRLIQGSFTINMKAGDYLHEMLYQAYAAENATTAGNSTATSTNLLQIANSIAIPDPFADPAGFAAWEQQQISTFWQTPQVSSLIQPKDLSRQAYFMNSGFTIVLVYGDIDSIDLSRNAGRVRTIENVHPMSAQQIISPTGENIVEHWQFMATDMNSANRQNFDAFAQ